MSSSPLILPGGATVAADGTGVVAYGPVPWGVRWAIGRIVVSCTDTAGTTLTADVYVGSISKSATQKASDRRDGTQTGRSDTADYVLPVYAYSGELVVIVWRGATPGSICTGRLEGTAEPAG